MDESQGKVHLKNDYDDIDESAWKLHLHMKNNSNENSYVWRKETNLNKNIEILNNDRKIIFNTGSIQIKSIRSLIGNSSKRYKGLKRGFTSSKRKIDEDLCSRASIVQSCFEISNKNKEESNIHGFSCENKKRKNNNLRRSSMLRDKNKKRRRPLSKNYNIEERKEEKEEIEDILANEDDEESSKKTVDLILDNDHYFRMSQKTFTKLSETNTNNPKNCWVPGYRSKLEKFISRRDDVVRAPKMKPDKFRKSKFQYNEEDVSEARSKPIIRCSSKFTTKEENERKEEKIRRRKILVKRRVVDKKTGEIKDEPVEFRTLFRRTSYKRDNFLNKKVKFRPASAHKFREVDKRKWVGGGDFTVF